MDVEHSNLCKNLCAIHSFIHSLPIVIITGSINLYLILILISSPNEMSLFSRSVLFYYYFLFLPLFSRGFSTTTPPPSLQNSLFALNVETKVRPEIRDNFLKELKDNQSGARGDDEPDCLQFVLGQDVENENTFYLFELYRNVNAYLYHTKTPHFLAYRSFVEANQPFTQEPRLCFYHPMEEQTDSTTTMTKRPIHKNAFGLNVNLYPKASVREDFLRVISNNKKGTDTMEPLALQYTYGQATAAPGNPPLLNNNNGEVDHLVFHFHEQYAGTNHGKEGFEAHTSSPHFAVWEDFVATDPFEKDPEVFFYHILENE